MLNRQTYTPPPEAEAVILPLLPEHLRNQALRLLAQLSEHGCSTENKQGEPPREVALSRDK
jgi:hypothetical protein